MNGRRDVNSLRGRSRDSEHQRWAYGIHAGARRLEVDPGSVYALVLSLTPSARRSTLASTMSPYARSLRTLREHGYWSAALVPKGGQSLFAAALPLRNKRQAREELAKGGQSLFAAALPPLCALVLGGEGGLRPLVEKSCDLRVSIPV